MAAYHRHGHRIYVWKGAPGQVFWDRPIGARIGNGRLLQGPVSASSNAAGFLHRMVIRMLVSDPVGSICPRPSGRHPAAWLERAFVGCHGFVCHQFAVPEGWERGIRCRFCAQPHNVSYVLTHRKHSIHILLCAGCT